MNEIFLKVPSSHGYSTASTNHLWSLPEQLQTDGWQTSGLGSREGVHSPGPCPVLRGGLQGTPLIPPWQPSRWGLSHFHCLHSPATWLSTMSFIHWTTKQNPVFGRVSALADTHSTPCTDGQAAHRVPVSLRSCLKSLSCTQPEWAKQTSLRSQSPVLWPVYVCRQVVSAVPMLYQLVLKLSNYIII